MGILQDTKGQASFSGIIGAVAGAAIGGVISYYITYVVVNALGLVDDAIWSLVLILLPLTVAAIIGAVIVRVFS